MQKENNVIKNYIFISEPIIIDYNPDFRKKHYFSTDNLKYHKPLVRNKV